MFQHVSLCVDSVVLAPSLACLFILFLLFCCCFFILDKALQRVKVLALTKFSLSIF